MSHALTDASNNIFQLRHDVAISPNPHLQQLMHGVVCDTEGRGHPSPDDRQILEIVVDASEGFIPLWHVNTTLRWRFQPRSLQRFEKPDAVRGEVRRLFGEALLAWGIAAPVKFKEDNDLWDFEIVFRRSDECDNTGCVLASAFFPDAGRHKLELYPMLFAQSRSEQVSTLIHEVGHMFGLRHFFADVSEEAWPVEIFGRHRKFSIMNYGSFSVLTEEDKEDLRQLYKSAWSGALTQINGTPIRLVRPYSVLARTAETAGGGQESTVVASATAPQALHAFPASIPSTSAPVADNWLSDVYLRQFSAGKATQAGVESVADGGAPLTKADIPEKQDRVRAELHRIIEEHLGNDAALKGLADKIVRESTSPLMAVADRDDVYLRAHPEKTSLLEVIVRTDGSRPSFMVRYGDIDFSTSPVGIWQDVLLPPQKLIKTAISCVGRIDVGGSHVGTGFLIHENLVVTNRHVLQGIARENGGHWTMKPSANIDFGREFRGDESVRPRNIRGVAYCGPQVIDPYSINHRKLDLALLELEPATDDNRPTSVLKFGLSPEWAQPGRSGYVYTIGYPGSPGLQGTATYGTSLLELLFKSTYGCKRFAPGETMSSADAGAAAAGWTAAHDATTLGGNSGSVILVGGQEYVAAGLHYGGRLGAPRENWAHVLGKTLEVSGVNGRTLKDCLDEYGVQREDIV